MDSHAKIPRPTVKRLSLYLRELESLAASEKETISSRQLGDLLGLTDAQVRKDLAYFGQFGHPGIGYQIPDLIASLRRILGTDRKWPVAVVGVGNIGRAIVSYGRLAPKGFEIKAAFDNDPSVIGSVVGGLKVLPMSKLAEEVHRQDIRIGLLAVPAPVAQQAADALIAAGILGILNFAPTRLQMSDDVAIVSVDLTQSLEQLAFKISLGLTGTAEQERSEIGPAADDMEL